MTVLLRLLPWFVLLGCGAPPAPTTPSPGVGRAVFEARANGTDLVKVTVLFPADGSTPRRGPHPGVVFIQGGFVSPAQYEWWAEALARVGYVVALPDNLGQLAFFSVGFGETARQLLVEPPPGSVLDGLVDARRIAVAGHSLGSVVATKLALSGEFKALLLQAGLPDPADGPRLSSLPPSLSLVGGSDCQAKPADMRVGWEGMPAPTGFAVLEEVTHFQFSASDEPDRARSCPPTLPLEEAHRRIVRASLTFLDEALGPNPPDFSRLEAPGLTVEAR